MIENSGDRPHRPERPSGANLFREKVAFRKPFDEKHPEVSTLDQLKVAEAFAGVVEDTLVKHFNDVHSEVEDKTLTVFLGVDLDEDNKIGVTVNNGEQSSIHVQHETDGRGSEGFIYQRDKTGAVIRYDSPAVPLISGSPEEFLQKPWEETEKILRDVKANHELEVGMGLNSQPITLVELKGVEHLLSEATPRTDLDL